MDRGNTKDKVSLQIFQVKIRTIQISVNLLTSRQFFPERLWDLDLPTRKSKYLKKKKNQTETNQTEATHWGYLTIGANLENVKNTHAGVLLLVKLHATKSNSPP